MGYIFITAALRNIISKYSEIYCIEKPWFPNSKSKTEKQISYETIILEKSYFEKHLIFENKNFSNTKSQHHVWTSVAKISSAKPWFSNYDNFKRNANISQSNNSRKYLLKNTWFWKYFKRKSQHDINDTLASSVFWKSWSF